MAANPADLQPFEPACDRFGEVEIWRASVSAMDNIAYLVVDRRSGEALLVDAADEPMRLAELVAVAEDAVRAENEGLDLAAAERPGIRVTGILTTHRHADHWQALERMRDRLAVPSYAGELDADAIGGTVDRPLPDGATLRLGATSLEAILLRGHTPGSIALAIEEEGEAPRLLTGDSLFPGGPGRTWSPEDFAQLMDDLEARLFDRFPDETPVYPGHGAPTTLGAERPHLAEWRERGW